MSGEQIMQENSYTVIINHERCICCGLCVQNCRRQIFIKTEEGIQISEVQKEVCSGCLQCVFICPQKVITVQDRPYKKLKQGPMPFYELAECRQSIRHFTKQPVRHEDLLQCVEAVRLMPSGANAHQMKFILVEEEQNRKALAQAIHYKDSHVNIFTQIDLPAFFVVVQEEPSEGQLLNVPFGFPTDCDTGIAATYFCLQATELGLSTCMIHRFDEIMVKQVLHVPEQKRIQLVIAVGYATIDYSRYKQRKPLKELLCLEQYCKSDL